MMNRRGSPNSPNVTSVFVMAVSAVRLIAAFAITKVVAMTLGASGLAVFSQFQAVQQLVFVLGRFGSDVGITRLIAANHNSLEAVHAIRLLGGLTVAVSTSVFGILLFLFQDEVARLINLPSGLMFSIELLAMTLVFQSVYGLALAILNGFRLYSVVNAVTLLQSAGTALLTCVLTYMFGLHGAMVSIAAAGVLSLGALVTATSLMNVKLAVFLPRLSGGWPYREANQLRPYILMAVISMSAAPMSAITIRSIIEQAYGVESMGEWQAVWYLMVAFSTVVHSMLTVQFMPNIASDSRPISVFNEFRRVYVLIAILIVAGLFVVTTAADFLVSALFTEDFRLAAQLLPIFFFAESLKILAAPLIFYLISTGHTKAYSSLDVVFTALTIVAYKFGSEALSIELLPLAPMLSNTIYLFAAIGCFYIFQVKIHQAGNN